METVSLWEVKRMCPSNKPVVKRSRPWYVMVRLWGGNPYLRSKWVTRRVAERSRDRANETIGTEAWIEYCPDME